MKALFTTTALGMMLAVSPALAQGQSQDQMQQQQPPAAEQQQTPPAGQDDAQQPGATTDVPKSDEAAKEPSDEADKTAEAPGDELNFITAQEQGEWLANDLIGANVMNAEDESIGSVSDIIVAEDGSVDGVVIGVGGFLGIGQKDVAVEYGSLDVTRDENNNLRVMLNTTKEDLDAAPEFKDMAELEREQSAPAAGGDGSAMQDRPATGGQGTSQ